MPVAPGVGWWRAPVPGPLRHVNGYVLDDGDALTLVDSGLNSDATLAGWRALLSGPLAGRRVSRVVATHCHPDHIGLAGWLCRKTQAPLATTQAEWLSARVAVANAAAPDVGAETRFRVAAGWSEADIAAAPDWGRVAGMMARLPHDYVRLRDGDPLAGAWRVVTGNGHSPDHACLLDDARGLFVSGDQVLPRISSNIGVGSGEPFADPLGDWFASIEKLRALPADLLVLPGHGEPFTGLHARLDAIEAEHRDRLAALEAALAEPQRVTDCFATLFARPIGADVIGLATGEALAHLRFLEARGRIARDERDGVWWFART